MTITNIPDIRNDYNFFPFRRFIPEIQKEYIKNPEEYRKRPDYLVNYFFAKPDYEVPHEKVFYSTLLGLKVGAIWGTFDVCASKLGALKPSFILFAKRVSILTATFATYGAVSSAAANIRGNKDDILNHAIAGGSLGFIFGYMAKSSAEGSKAGAVCAAIGMAFKAFQQSGSYFFHPETMKLIERGSLYGNPDLRFFEHQELKERRQHYLFEDM